MQAKIRNAQLQKVPFMLVVGKREAEAGAVAVRLRTGEDLGAMPVAEFAAFARGLAESKALTLTPEVVTTSGMGTPSGCRAGLTAQATLG